MEEKMVKLDISKLRAIDDALRYVWMASGALGGLAWASSAQKHIDDIYISSRIEIIQEKRYKELQGLIKKNLKEIKRVKKIKWWAKNVLDTAMKELKNFRVEYV